SRMIRFTCDFSRMASASEALLACSMSYPIAPSHRWSRSSTSGLSSTTRIFVVTPEIITPREWPGRRGRRPGELLGGLLAPVARRQGGLDALQKLAARDRLEEIRECAQFLAFHNVVDACAGRQDHHLGRMGNLVAKFAQHIKPRH